MSMQQATRGPMLTVDQVAERRGVSKQRLYALMAKGEFPRPAVNQRGISGRSLWPESVVEAALRAPPPAARSSGWPRARPAEAAIQGYYCPLVPAPLMELRLKSGKFILTEAGLEKRCARCTTYWPLDTEFWFSGASRRDGLHDWCRACYLAWRYPDGRGRGRQPGSPAPAFSIPGELMRLAFL